MSKRKMILILIVLCLCLVVIIGIMISIWKKQDNAGGEIVVELDKGRSAENQLLLSNFGVFSEKYKGSIETSEINEYLQNLTKEYIPNLYSDIKDFSDEELENYYQENFEEIESKFGKINVEEFKEFAQKLQKITIDLTTWYKINILRDTFVYTSEKTGYSYVEYELSFEDDSKLVFYMYISKNETTNPNFIIDFDNL